MTVLLFFAELTYVCSRDRLFHVKHQAPCQKVCIYIHITADGMTAQFISRSQTLSQMVAVNQAGLKPVVVKEQQPLIPLFPQRLVDSCTAP